MAIQDFPEKKAEQEQIYEWITNSFPFYLTYDKNWKLSVYHSLIKDKCFQRQKCGAWAIVENVQVVKKAVKKKSEENVNEKPKYSYKDLAIMAIQDFPEKKAEEGQICDWITNKFPFYLKYEKVWRGGIYQTLAKGKSFQREKR